MSDDAALHGVAPVGSHAGQHASRARVAGSLAEIVMLYDRWADERYDELVTQRDHAEQCAALAVAAGAPDELVAAALLHDVGHLLHLNSGASGPDAERDRGHETLGAAYLAGVLPPAVTTPVALHVAAKRYRCAVDPHYREGLSAGSRRSLILQGGPATPTEIAELDATPGFDDAVALRAWDDSGKVEELVTVPFEQYRGLLERLCVR